MKAWPKEGRALEGRRVVFVLLWLCAFFAAMAYWAQCATAREPALVCASVKTASTGCLALALWLVALSGSTQVWPIALGLSLGALGDWFLAQRGQTAFLAGMAAFGAGHLAYTGGFVARSAEIGFPGADAPRILAAVLLLGLLLSTEVWLSPRTGQLRWPVRAYVALIGLMGFSLIGLPDQQVAGYLQLGGGLFILSDLLLALRLFLVAKPQHQARLSFLLWPAYWVGQALIAFFWMMPHLPPSS